MKEIVIEMGLNLTLPQFIEMIRYGEPLKILFLMAVPLRRCMGLEGKMNFPTANKLKGPPGKALRARNIMVIIDVDPISGSESGSGVLGPDL